MKHAFRPIAALLLLLAAPAVTIAQAPQASTPCFQVVGSADYNFGTIEQSQPVRHTFEFINNCKDSVHITSAQASCGCTAAIISAKDIGPGAKASIDVKFTPNQGSRGSVSKTVSVYLRDNPQPVTVLRISAKIASDFETNPAYVQLLGAQVGKETTGKVSVTNTTQQELEISPISASMTAYADTSAHANPTSSNAVAVQMEGVKVSPTSLKLKPGESADVTVTLTPKWQGQVNGSILLQTKKGQTYVQVFGVVRPAETAQSH